MKKLDLHIHTIQTISDSPFSLSIEKLKEYIKKLNIDGIAITNHNVFDIVQYKSIQAELLGICEVFPGIEINVGETGFGHLICITSQDDIEDFSNRCQNVQDKISNPMDKITFEELKQVFSDFAKYLWIPHYDKKPILDTDTISDMQEYILCGEVGSVKKFIYCQKNDESLTPVYFSDLRPTDDMNSFPTRQTYFDIDEITVKSIKKALIDKSHVALTEQEGNSLFYVLPDLPISTGLNIVIGERSSGKTYTLDQIAEQHENIKYIKQFELIEPNPEKEAKEFTDKIAAKRSSFAEEYFELFREAVDTVKNISIKDDEYKIEQYVSSLVQFAKEADRADMFARCALYSETKFPKRNFDNITELIKAVEKLLDAREYRDIIEKYLPRESLIALHEDLIKKHNCEKRRSLEEIWVNDLIEKIKQSLSSRTAAINISDVDFYNCQMNRVKVRKFNELVDIIKKESVINRQQIESFVIQTSKRSFSGANELKLFSGRKNVAFSKIIDAYDVNPYEYLLGIKDMSDIPETDYYKYFAYVDYQIQNQYGFSVSGGERAEFKLLQKINEAYRYDMLLIDEPESSFDNLFLRDRVNHIIKELAKNMPVILATHNNTVGASIKPDYLIYTKRNIADEVSYERYYGLPSSKELISSSGDTIRNIQALLDCLEAGEITYNERKHNYDLLKD